MELADPVAEVLRLPPGTGVWGWVSGDHGSPPRPTLLGRVAPGDTRRISRGAVVQHRVGALVREGVGLIAWMASIDRVPEWTFGTWIDVHATSIPNPVPDLCRQANLDLLLFEDEEVPTRRLRIRNRLPWSSLATKLPSTPWSAEAFSREQARLQALCPDARSLWRALGEGPVVQRPSGG